MPARKRPKADPTYNSCAALRPTVCSTQTQADARLSFRRRYLGKILKSKHPELCISRNALRMANGIAEELASRLVTGSGKVAKSAKKSTLSSRHVQAATRVMRMLRLVPK